MINITFLLAVFANVWIWKIFSYDIFVGVLVVLCSFLLYKTCSKFLSTPGESTSDAPGVIFIVLFILLLFFQTKTTDIKSLTVLSNHDIYVRDMRLKEYPPVKVTLFNKTIWIPAAHWFEGRKESIAFFRILNNLSEVVDPNLYFFANHPRERVGIAEFEKFPYIFLPFFIYGLLILAKEKKKILWISFLIPLVELSIIGNRNPIGSFSMFPFISITTAFGIYKVLQKIPKKYFRKIVFVGGVLLILVLKQMIAYATN